MTSLGGIISWEGTDSTSVVLGTLSWVELEGSMSWGFKFSVGHIVGLIVGGLRDGRGETGRWEMVSLFGGVVVFEVDKEILPHQGSFVSETIKR